MSKSNWGNCSGNYASNEPRIGIRKDSDVGAHAHIAVFPYAYAANAAKRNAIGSVFC